MFEAPPLQRNIPIVVPATGIPSTEYHVWWQSVITNLQNTINSQQDQIDAIQAALNTANESKRNTARISSYTVPTVVLTASDAGTDAKITIASHTRVYPDDGALVVPDVSITGGNITGLAYSTQYYVYYDDPTLTNTTPTFVTTTTATVAQVGAGSSRHFLGVVTTPASGGGSTSGGGGTPPGGGGGPIP